jgi:hypothetical protein
VLALRGLGAPPPTIRVDGAATNAWRWEDDTLRLPLSATAAAQHVALTRGDHDHQRI